MSDELYEGPTLLAPGSDDRGRRLASRLLIPVSLLFFVIIMLFYVLFTAFTVRGESMETNLLDGDRLLVTKSYAAPHRGDIVVFETLDSRNRIEDLVKRVVAIPGDTVEIRRGIAIVNGLVENTPGIRTSPYDPTYLGPVLVPRGHVFVMGDNRPIALDSRSLGPVPLYSIRGRAVFRLSPITRMRTLQ